MLGEAEARDAPRRTHLELADLALRSGPAGDQFGARDGLSLDRLRSDYPSGVATAERMDPGASWQRVAHEDGKAHLWTAVIASEFERLQHEKAGTQGGELKMFGRRLLHGMNSWMHNDEKVIRNARPTLLMHPTDARDRQIEDGQEVRVRSKTNAVDVIVEVSDEVVPGSVNYPHGFGPRRRLVEGKRNGWCQHQPARIQRPGRLGADLGQLPSGWFCGGGDASLTKRDTGSPGSFAAQRLGFCCV